jgi:uncharacterized protein (TIGR03435 family)
LAKTLSMNYLGGQPVIDQTSLSGVYDFTLDCHTALMERGGSVLTVLPEQLELELKLLDVLVIDHAEEITGGESSQTQQQDQGVADRVTASMPPAGVYNAVSIFKSAPNPMPTWDLTPDGFSATNVTLQNLIQWAYGVEGFQIFGAPNWLNLERYDLKAKVDRSVANDMRNLTEEQLRSKQQPMLLELLADLIKLQVHRETRELPVYELVVEGKGAKLQQAMAGELPQLRFGKGLIAGRAAPLSLAPNGRPSLVRMLSLELQRPVLDKTGLKSTYDFSLEWTPDDRLGVEHGPSLFVAIQEQLGLKLLPSNEQTAPVEVLVIDHAERLSGNEQADAARLN